jgi:glucosamine-6-phosphate deaminase
MFRSVKDLHGMSPEEVQRAANRQLLVLPDPASLYAHFAGSIADEIDGNNRAGKPTRLILPLGPRGQYPLLARICNERRISWASTHVFFMDEYLDWQGRPLPAGHPLSFEGHARRQMFDLLDPPLRLPESQLHFPHPFRLDELAKEIEAGGGIGSCYGGIGIHGHIAFNEPPTLGLWRVTAEAFRNSMPRVVFLNPETVTMGAARWTGGDVANFPPMAVTLGMKQLLGASRVRLYCDGGIWQRTVLRAALFLEPTIEYPVTLLRDHLDWQIVADRTTVGYPGAGERELESSTAL